MNNTHNNDPYNNDPYTRRQSLKDTLTLLRCYFGGTFTKPSALEPKAVIMLHPFDVFHVAGRRTEDNGKFAYEVPTYDGEPIPWWALRVSVQ